MTNKSQRDLHDYISDVSQRSDVRAGFPLPLGTQEVAGGVNFAVFSRNAACIRLELFDHPQDAAPSRDFELDAAHHRTGDVWHIWLKGIRPGQLYAYRLDGPYQPSEAHRFNFKRLLLAPFASAISGSPPWDFASALGYDPSSSGKDLTSSKLDNGGTSQNAFLSTIPERGCPSLTKFNLMGCSYQALLGSKNIIFRNTESTHEYAISKRYRKKTGG